MEERKRGMRRKGRVRSGLGRCCRRRRGDMRSKNWQFGLTGEDIREGSDPVGLHPRASGWMIDQEAGLTGLVGGGRTTF